jgi:nitroimidazol reductase NimA-like FMN-containing flavoprotein (pyridoxamine 5'-phosphate oxidase superfamily)
MLKPFHGMVRQLNSDEIDQILLRNNFAHLGCHHHSDIYVVPVSYVYDSGYIYSHSKPGKKIDMMRKQARVCFQVEEIHHFLEWKSVIAWGEFEEMKGEAATAAMRLLLTSLSQKERLIHASSLEIDISAQIERAIIYRVKVEKSTGRYEGPMY